MHKNKDKPRVIDGVRVSYGESNVSAATRERMMAPIEVDKKKRKGKNKLQKLKAMTPEQAGRYFSSEVQVRHYIKKKEKADIDIASQFFNFPKDVAINIPNREEADGKLVRSPNTRENGTLEKGPAKATEKKQKQTRSRRKGPAAADIPMTPLGKKTNLFDQKKKFYPHLTLTKNKKNWVPPPPPPPSLSTTTKTASKPSVRDASTSYTTPAKMIHSIRAPCFHANRLHSDPASSKDVISSTYHHNNQNFKNAETNTDIKVNTSEREDKPTQQPTYAYVVSHKELKLHIRLGVPQESCYEIAKQNDLKMTLRRKRKRSMDNVDDGGYTTLVAKSPRNTPLPKTSTLVPTSPLNTPLPSKFGVLSPLNTPLPPKIARLH